MRANRPGKSAMRRNISRNLLSRSSRFQSLRLASEKLAHHFDSVTLSPAFLYCNILRRISPSEYGCSFPYDSTNFTIASRGRSVAVSPACCNRKWCYTFGENSTRPRAIMASQEIRRNVKTMQSIHAVNVMYLKVPGLPKLSALLQRSDDI